MYLFQHPIMYIYQDILDTKKRYSVSLRDCFSLNVNISVIGLEEFNNLFSHFFFRYTRILKQKYDLFKNCHKICAKPSEQNNIPTFYQLTRMWHLCKKGLNLQVLYHLWLFLHRAPLMIPALISHALLIRGHVRQFIHVQKFNPCSPQTPIFNSFFFCDFHNLPPLAPQGYSPACPQALLCHPGYRL